VTYFVEQLNAANVSKDHYRVVFKPTTIVPDIDVTAMDLLPGHASGPAAILEPKLPGANHQGA
jgi:hypothetical protein